MGSKKRRKYACFVPDDRPKKLPPPGHPDWEEYVLPMLGEGKQVEASYERNVLCAMLVRALVDLNHHCPYTKRDAIEWVEDGPSEPGSFPWVCELLELNRHVILERVRRGVKPITDAEWNAWKSAANARVGRDRARKRAKYILTRDERGRILRGEQEGMR